MMQYLSYDCRLDHHTQMECFNQRQMMLPANWTDVPAVPSTTSPFPLPTATNCLATQLLDAMHAIYHLSENICQLTEGLDSLLSVITLPPGLHKLPNQAPSPTTICPLNLRPQTSHLTPRLTFTSAHHKHHKPSYTFMDNVTYHHLAHNYCPPNPTLPAP